MKSMLRIDTRARLEDILLPPAQLRKLKEIVAARGGAGAMPGARAWSRTRGVVALFVGPTGTAKTAAAKAIAHELGRPLYRVDLSRVVSKYIGDTEKNLGRVFDAATEKDWVLLFDEADALFGRRSEVNDSHDRYANLESSFLLDRIERFKGITILTTNMKASLDNAFMRRMRYVVQFRQQPKPEGHGNERRQSVVKRAGLSRGRRAR
jgi:SpoVK/Ycf46/Vps4 family AAA+-type ATPase